MFDGFTSESRALRGEALWGSGPPALAARGGTPVGPTSVHDLVLFPEIRQAPQDL